MVSDASGSWGQRDAASVTSPSSQAPTARPASTWLRRTMRATMRTCGYPARPRPLLGRPKGWSVSGGAGRGCGGLAAEPVPGLDNGAARDVRAAGRGIDAGQDQIEVAHHLLDGAGPGDRKSGG